MMRAGARIGAVPRPVKAMRSPIFYLDESYCNARGAVQDFAEGMLENARRNSRAIGSPRNRTTSSPAA